MQAAIDRVFRSLTQRAAPGVVRESQPEASPAEPEALADRLLENLKAQLVRNAAQRH